MATGAEIIGTLTAIGGTVKSLAEAVSAARKAAPAKRTPTDEFLVKVNDLVLGLQSRLIELQGAILQLQAENGQLREQVREHEARALDREGYERRQLGEATVYVPKDSPKTFLCPTCFDRGQKSYLSRLPRKAREAGSHCCTVCAAIFPITGGV